MPTEACKRCGQDPVLLSINGEDVKIDACIADMIYALNDAGLKTKHCCCGHGGQYKHGYISFSDGRYMQIRAMEHYNRSGSVCRYCGGDELLIFPDHTACARCGTEHWRGGISITLLGVGIP